MENKTIKNKEFKLRDFENSFNKWNSYKKEKTNLFFLENKDLIRIYLNDKLFFNVIRELNTKLENFSYLDLFKKPLTKTLINRLMTIINGITYNKNKDFIGGLDNLNENEKKAYTTILYLRYYNPINKIMKQILIEYLKDYNKKVVLNQIR